MTSISFEAPAVRLLDTHVRHGAVCSGCGRAWPCHLVLLADHNLTLVGETTPAHVPPPDRTTASAGRSWNHAVSPALPVPSVAAGCSRTPPAAPHRQREGRFPSLRQEKSL
ncbi:hypothetical protein [Protofrankia symbiont of Coriaria ruscifolia]|uniref:hypothetical protein n=1 Tax=Protofrankia symbiont of Coriaria ruscifolia TaxID=1306542 RepID=UPI0010410F1D|nr:hypothetical protein [Protofrankia symbiont of Coriaria ruscifolia]